MFVNAFGILFCCYLIVIVVLSPIAALVIKISVLSYNGIEVTAGLVGSNEFWDDQNLVAYGIIFLFCAIALFCIGSILWSGFFWLIWKIITEILKFLFCKMCYIRCNDKKEDIDVELLSVY